MNPQLILFMRIALAAIWFYNGLWMKVIALDAHHLQIVSSVASGHIDAAVLLRSIGGCETLLAIGILSGLFHRFVNYFQIAVIVLMNLIGIAFGGGAIEHPVGLLLSNVPTVLCALTVALYGPGACALRLPDSGSGKDEGDV